MNQQTDNVQPTPTQHISLQIVLASLVIWVVASLLLLASLWPKMGTTLHWDEVDYVQATRQGFMANATDSSAFSAIDFLRFVSAKFKRSPSPDFPNYNEIDDVFVLRHTHPPLLQYVLAMLGPSRLNPGHEIAIRLIQFSGASLLIAALIWGYLKISDNHSLAGLAGVAVVGVLCGFFMGRDLNCHLWIAVSLPFTCISVGQFMAQSTRKRGIVAGGAIGLNFLGLQTGVFVAFWAVVAVGIAILLPPSATDVNCRKLNFRQMLRAWVVSSLWMFIGFLAFVLVTYPGAFLRLSLIRIFATYAFLIMKSNEYAGVSSRYSSYLNSVFPLLLLGVIGLIGVIFRKRSERWYLTLATVVIGFGYGLVLLKFLLNIIYITPALALLGMLGMATVSSCKKLGLEIVIAIALISFTFFTITNWPESSIQNTNQTYNQLAETIGSRQALIEGGHIINYYCPLLASRVLPVSFAFNQKTLYWRDPHKLQYKPITPDQLAGSIVVLRIFNILPEYEWEKQLPAGVRKIQIPGLGGAIYEFPPASSDHPKVEPAIPATSPSPTEF